MILAYPMIIDIPLVPAICLYKVWFLGNAKKVKYRILTAGFSPIQHHVNTRMSRTCTNYAQFVHSLQQHTHTHSHTLIYSHTCICTCTCAGTGTFGRVVLARDIPSKGFFALKIMTISEVIRLRQVEHVNSEKSILASISHPFIVNM